MDRDNRSWPMRIVAGIWRGLDRLRRLLHLILLLGLFLLLLIGVVGERVLVPDSAALVIAPQGSLVDQLSGDALERAIAKAQGTPLQETLVRDVIDGLRAARDDERIKVVVLDLDGLTGAGLSKLQEIAARARSLQAERQTCHRGGRWLHARSVLPRGPSRRRLHASRWVSCSSTATAGSCRTTNRCSTRSTWTTTSGRSGSTSRSSSRSRVTTCRRRTRRRARCSSTALWTAYQADVTAARGLAAPALQQYADDIVTLLQEAGGDTAQLAVNYGLVDELLTRDAMRERIRAAIGERRSTSRLADAYTEVSLDDYVTALRTETPPAVQPSKVAVIVAAGTILDGSAAAGRDRRRFDGRADPPRARRRGRQSARAARGFRRRQRVRVGRHSARARAVPGDEAARRRVDGQRRGVGWLLDRDVGRRDLGEPDDADGVDRRGRHDPDDSTRARLVRRARRRYRDDGVGGRARHHAAARRQLQGPHRPVDTQDVRRFHPQGGRASRAPGRGDRCRGARAGLDRHATRSTAASWIASARWRRPSSRRPSSRASSAALTCSITSSRSSASPSAWCCR